MAPAQDSPGAQHLPRPGARRRRLLRAAIAADDMVAWLAAHPSAALGEKVR